MTVTEHKTIKILAGFSGEHCHFFQYWSLPKSYLWVSVSQRQGKICITELISGTFYRFFSYNVYGNRVESIWRDIVNVYEIYGLYWI